jgi:hypothetical protein
VARQREQHPRLHGGDLRHAGRVRLSVAIEPAEPGGPCWPTCGWGVTV